MYASDGEGVMEKLISKGGCVNFVKCVWTNGSKGSVNPTPHSAQREGSGLRDANEEFDRTPFSISQRTSSNRSQFLHMYCVDATLQNHLSGLLLLHCNRPIRVLLNVQSVSEVL